MKTEKDKDLLAAKKLLLSLEFIIGNPVLETKAEVRALKRIRTRLKKAIKKLERGTDALSGAHAESDRSQV